MCKILKNVLHQDALHQDVNVNVNYRTNNLMIMSNSLLLSSVYRLLVHYEYFYAFDTLIA